jgi:hypothetical protein
VKLLYKKIDFTLTFAQTLRFPMPPAFVLRSVIGYHLRGMCCITHSSTCVDCAFRDTCAYGFAFESIVPQGNMIIAGRNRISHPVIIETDPFIPCDANTFVASLIILGTAISTAAIDLNQGAT